MDELIVTGPDPMPTTISTTTPQDAASYLRDKIAEAEKGIEEKTIALAEAKTKLKALKKALKAVE